MLNALKNANRAAGPAKSDLKNQIKDGLTAPSPNTRAQSPFVKSAQPAQQSPQSPPPMLSKFQPQPNGNLIKQNSGKPSIASQVPQGVFKTGH